MPLGIDPTVDYVFKRLFGDPANADVLIHLLNSVLEFPDPITEVTILNPSFEKESESDKLAILDVKAKDCTGRLFNVEIQTSITIAIKERLVYYTSCLYTEQLLEGVSYARLRPAICICFLSSTLFRNTSEPHLAFFLADAVTGIRLTDQFQIHTVELSKYNLSEAELTTATRLQKWAWFMNHASECDAARLRSLLTAPEHLKATGVIEVISKSPEEKMLYDARMKAIRDQKMFTEDLIEANQIAVETARKVAIQEGRQEGRLVGRIQTLQEMLDEPVVADEVLISMSNAELELLLEQLRARFSNRRQ